MKLSAAGAPFSNLRLSIDTLDSCVVVVIFGNLASDDLPESSSNRSTILNMPQKGLLVCDLGLGQLHLRHLSL